MRTSQWFKVVGMSVALSVVLLPLAVAQEGGAQEGGGEGRRPAAEGARGAGRARMGGGGMTAFGMDKSMLLRSEQVQTELKITEEQKGKIEAALTAYREKSRGQMNMQGLRDLSAEEREKKMTEMREARVKLVAELDKEMAGILDKAQMKRLNGIELQQRGVMALTDEKVAKALKVTDEQKKAITAAMEAGREKQTKLFEEMRAAGGGGGQNREAFAQMREKRLAIQKETDASVLGVLNEEQKKAFDEMKGKAFELDPQSMRGGRGGFGGGQGGQRGQRPEGATPRQRPPAE